MDAIEFIVGKIVEKNGADAKRFIIKKDEFLNTFIKEYTVIIKQSIERPNMITNPEILTSNIDISNIAELQKAITKHLFTKLHTNNFISEREFDELCKGESL